ncbi:MAG: hypothetical protein WAM51_06555, partial [Methylovirgula sp.]
TTLAAEGKTAKERTRPNIDWTERRPNGPPKRASLPKFENLPLRTENMGSSPLGRADDFFKLDAMRASAIQRHAHFFSGR